MCSTKNGSNVVPPTSSSPFSPEAAPDEVAVEAAGAPPQDPPAPPPAGDEGPSNAFEAVFLARLADQEDPPTASEAEFAGPWRVEPLPAETGGGFGLFREGEGLLRRARPFARFESYWTAQLIAALLPCLGRDAAYRFREEKDARGWAIESREAWGAVVAHVDVFQPALIEALHVADGLMRSPAALAAFLDACGPVALERAGAILAAKWEGRG
jgi:hypothetical protein